MAAHLDNLHHTEPFVQKFRQPLSSRLGELTISFWHLTRGCVVYVA